MFKRIIVTFLLVAVLANAQDDYSYGDSDGSSATQSSQEAQPAASAPSDDYSMSVSIHPISMAIFSLIGMPSIIATVENNLGTHLSLVSRPELMWLDVSDKDESISMFLVGLYEGVRYYFREGHRGWYVSPQIGYEHVSMEYTYKYDHDDDKEASVNAFVFVVYGGYKYTSGRFVMAMDVGMGYTVMSGSASDAEDAEEIAGNGFGFDLNFSMGFAF